MEPENRPASPLARQIRDKGQEKETLGFHEGNQKCHSMKFPKPRNLLKNEFPDLTVVQPHCARYIWLHRGYVACLPLWKSTRSMCTGAASLCQIYLVTQCLCSMSAFMEKYQIYEQPHSARYIWLHSAYVACLPLWKSTRSMCSLTVPDISGYTVPMYHVCLYGKVPDLCRMCGKMER